MDCAGQSPLDVEILIALIAELEDVPQILLISVTPAGYHLGVEETFKIHGREAYAQRGFLCRPMPPASKASSRSRVTSSLGSLGRPSASTLTSSSQWRREADEEHREAREATRVNAGERERERLLAQLQQQV
eukprot:1875994-Pyramimonas_sp.AAC.1